MYNLIYNHKMYAMPLTHVLPSMFYVYAQQIHANVYIYNKNGNLLK